MLKKWSCWRCRVLVAVICTSSLVTACTARQRAAPTRGYILISLDTLGARHLGAYGNERDTSPFFDRLAARATLFENAFVQYPSTLVSHASMFTGLYPREHGVWQPGQRLSPEIEMMPERFRAAGFTTGAFTEGGFVSSSHGFDRGFDEFYQRKAFSPDDEIERTFARGLDFLAGLRSDERFFLFLHTYSVHDPYVPPEPYRSMFAVGAAGDGVDSSGKYLREIYMGRRTISAAEAGHLQALYDGSVRYVDGVLETFFERLAAMGLDDEVTVVITSDHGEEFLQHGSLGHFQAYVETLHVPLLVVHPDRRVGQRISTPVESVDLPPTLFELAGLSEVEMGSGRSLAVALGGGELLDREVFGEVFDQRSQLSVIQRREGKIFQYLTTKLVAEDDGTWVTREASFDLSGQESIELVSFAELRTVSVTVDGKSHATVQVGGEWTPIRLEPASESRRVTLSTEGCSVPLYLGVSEDSRCLSFKVRGAVLRRGELFELSTDPPASHDLSSVYPEIGRELERRLSSQRWTLRASPITGTPSAESSDVLRALGYIE